MFVRDLGDADATCGGKAAALARLLAAGLPVPDGFVIEHGAFDALAGEVRIDDVGAIGHALRDAAERIATAPLPEPLAREALDRAKHLGSRLAVRSSATIEDGEAGAAAGVFSSRTAVAPSELWDAIRAVWTSALTPLAATYARRRGGAIAIAVIVQPFIEGERVTVYTRPPGRPEANEVLVQRGETLRRFARDAAASPHPAEHAAAMIALRAEQAIDAKYGADVELIQAQRGRVIETFVVQARPIVHPLTRPAQPPPPSVLAALDDGRVWTWDVAHNPDPLSVAQTELVERVERAGLGHHALRVCAGFLYTTPRGTAPFPRVTSAEELAALAAPLEAALEHTLGTAPPRSLDEAIDRYLAFYRIWAGELGPLISAARRVLPEALRGAGLPDPDIVASEWIGHRPSAVEVTLAAAARGELDIEDVEQLLGPLSPAWDVAVPTYGERPGLLSDAIARVRNRDMPGAMRPATGQFVRQIALARAAADLAERDDAYFARAQLLVRRALLARAAELGLEPDDIFWIPFDAQVDHDEAHRRASGARNAAVRASRWQMPIVVGGPPPAARPSLHGVGTGPRVTGRVVRFASLASAIAVGSGDVVVTRAVTPALAVLVAGCAALVSETGGLLDHGAALARELGIPCVVGCRDAWSQLPDGIIVTVDGAAGTVERT